MKYIPYPIHLTDGQLATIARNHNSETPFAITLTKSSLAMEPNHNLPLTAQQIKRIEKAKEIGKGLRLTFSLTHVKHLSKEGGFISAILPFVTRFLPALSRIAAKAVPFLSKAAPVATKIAKVAGPALAFGGLSQLAANTVDKIQNKAPTQEGSGLVPAKQRRRYAPKTSAYSGSLNSKKKIPLRKNVKGGCGCQEKGQGLFQFGELQGARRKLMAPPMQ